MKESIPIKHLLCAQLYEKQKQYEFQAPKVHSIQWGKDNLRPVVLQMWAPGEWVSSSGHLLELQILRHHPRTKELETLEVGTSSLVHKLCRWFRFMLNLKNLCFRLSTSRGINQWTRHMELKAADRENKILYSKMLNWAVSYVWKGLEEGGGSALSRSYFLGEEVLNQLLRNE